MKRSMSMVCADCSSPIVEELAWRCPACSGPPVISSQVEFSRSRILRERRSLWRYARFLAVPNDAPVSLGEGQTPLVEVRPGLSVKLEYVSPTGSFKDRGSTTLLTLAKSLAKKYGFTRLTEDSSGNAGASIAAYSARAGLECEIFVPEKVSEAKLGQIMAYGARVVKIPGSREAVGAAAIEASRKGFYASHIWNPAFIEGVKTIAYEIAEQYEWNPPDNILLPCSAGTLLIGVVRGFRDLKESGCITEIPRIVGVQSIAISPVYHEFKGLRFTPPTSIEILTDALVNTKPPRLKEMLRLLSENGGGMEAVDDREVIAGQEALGRMGFFVEPSSAVVYPAWKRWRDSGMISKDEDSLLILTGSGLKSRPSLRAR